MALLALAACGSDPYENGAGSNCPGGKAPEHAQSLYDLVRASHWAEVSAVAERGDGRAGDPIQHARLTIQRSIRGGWPKEADVSVTAGAIEEARSERSQRAQLLAVGDSATAALVSLRQDGEVHFLGGCADQMFRPDVERFRAARVAAGDRRSEADLLRNAVESPSGAAAVALTALARGQRPPAAPRWEDAAPDDRVLDSATPVDVLAALEQRDLVFVLPEGWRDADVQLCPRVPGLAWGVCTLPQAATGEVPLETYAQAGTPIEIWVADRERGFRGRRELALTVPAARWEVATSIRLTGSAKVASTADAFAAARAGSAFRL